MRILVLSNLYPPVVRGGYEVECAAVVERLRARGDDVLVLTSALEAARAPANERGVIRELRFQPRETREMLRAAPVSAAAARSARRAVQRFVPDLAWVWNAAQIPLATIQALVASGLPIAYRVCDHWFGRIGKDDLFARCLLPGHHGPALGWALMMRAVNLAPALRVRQALPHRAAISWNSEAIRRLTGVPAGVQPMFERVIHSTSLNGPVFEAVTRAPAVRATIAYLGGLSSEQGADVLVKAVARLQAEHGVEADLVLAGPGDPAQRGAIEALGAWLGVAGRLSLPGPLAPADAAALLARAHVMAVPSVSAEAFPLVSIEGALARVPLVASRVGGIPEFLHDGEHALLFEPGDDVGCAAALAGALEDPDGAAARVERAFANAQRFKLDAYLDASEQFVDEAYAALRRA